MPSPPVPATVHIRTRSLPHVETDRLVRRLTLLRDPAFQREFVRTLENRRPMRDLAREMILIEREIERRRLLDVVTPSC